MRTTNLASLLGCVALLVALAPRSASALRATAEPSAAVVVSTASPSAIAVQEGLAKLHANDLENAMIDFQRAIAADLAAPDGHYYLGVALRRSDRPDRAIESFRTALARAESTNDLVFGARARVAIAMTYDRMPNRGDDARAAWVEVQSFGQANPSVLSAAIATSRIAAIDNVRELTRTYEPVRHRITERARHHGGHGRQH